MPENSEVDRDILNLWKESFSQMSLGQLVGQAQIVKTRVYKDENRYTLEEAIKEQVIFSELRERVQGAIENYKAQKRWKRTLYSKSYCRNLARLAATLDRLDGGGVIEEGAAILPLAEVETDIEEEAFHNESDSGLVNVTELPLPLEARNIGRYSKKRAMIIGGAALVGVGIVTYKMFRKRRRFA